MSKQSKDDNANDVFCEYVRETSFNLSLSSAQIRHLDLVANYGMGGLIANGIRMDTLMILKRKGLLKHDQDGPWSITDEGLLVHKLLVAARYVEEIKINEAVA